jgi:hypothetical protein
MKRTISIAYAMMFIAGAVQHVAAQTNVARFATERNRVYAAVALDPAIVSTLGYGRVVGVFGHDFQISGDASVVAAGFDWNDARARVGLQTSVLQWRSVHLTGSAAAIVRRTDNVNFRAINFGADLSTTLGVYRPGWFAAGEFGKDKAVITHLKHTDDYRDTLFPDAKDGWYLDAGGTYHYGFTGGVVVRGVEVGARFGWQQTEDFNDMTPPVYASIGIGFGF